MTMNAADLVILAVLVLSTLFGLWRGFVSEVLSLLCWIAAFWVAWAFGRQVATFYSGWVSGSTAALVAGYVTCFLGVLVAGALLSWMVRKLMSHGGLRGGDRFLGMLFGLGRGLLLVTAAVLILGFTAVPRESPWWRQSVLLPPFENGAAWFAGQLPRDAVRSLEIGGQSLPVVPLVPISALKAPGPRSAASVAPSPSGAMEHVRTPRGVGQ